MWISTPGSAFDISAFQPANEFSMVQPAGNDELIVNVGDWGLVEPDFRIMDVIENINKELNKLNKEDIKKAQETYVIGIIERDDNAYDEEKSDGFKEKFSELNRVLKLFILPYLRLATILP